MPRRTDISSILIIGAGPIVIGQAAEFDYSGTQAAKALKAEGYRIILVNSNPATIMTDPELADATYIEPITPDYVAAIIEKERPDAVLPTMGGQTALNTALALFKDGTLEKYGVQMIGADAAATAERAAGPARAGQRRRSAALARLRDGTLEKYGVQMIGADAAAIEKAEDRLQFRDAMSKIGLEGPRSQLAHSLEAARRAGAPGG